MGERNTVPIAVVAGATGFVGQAIVQALVEDGYDLRTIGRSGSTTWVDPDAIARAIDGSDLVVNMAGKSVNCRYTDANRDEILRSRVDTTRALRNAIEHAQQPPKTWINASTATIYRHETERANTEDDGILGTGFSVDVAREWERELFAGDLPHTRRIALRMAIVVGRGPAIRTLLTLARTGLGGPQIDGRWFPHSRYRGIGTRPTSDGRARGHRTRGGQRFSWVHLDDVIGILRFVIARREISGPVNVAAPHPSDNRTLMRSLRRVVRMPVGVPAWRWMLEPAMWVLRTEPELVLKSRWVMPQRLQNAGYAFKHPHLEPALRAVVADERASA